LRPAVTAITASLPDRTSLLAEAMATVTAQTVATSHLVGVDASRGVAEVRNDLVRATRTDWVAFLDDDDLLDPNHVELLLGCGANLDVVIPHCRFDGPPLPNGYCNRPFDRADLKRHGIFPITVLARREAILDAGGFPTQGRYEDWELWNAMADAGCRFEVIPETTWTYRTKTADRRTQALQSA
jgi:glycosyltransferase involved in cell wall biosynthesis